MFQGFRRHLTYSNVMATIAVFAALGGGAYAATKLPKNSVGAKQIKKNAVTTAKLKNGAVTGAKVRKGSLLAANFKAGQLPTGATGPAGSSGATGAVGPTGATGPAGPESVAAAGGGQDPPILISPLTMLVMASTPITVDETSDIVVWGSMGDQQVECAPVGCEGLIPSDSTDVGIYVESPGGTFPASVPGAGISMEGGGLTHQQVPPLSGVLKNMPAGTYTVKLILSTFGISTGTYDNGGGLPWVTAIATGAN